MSLPHMAYGGVLIPTDKKECSAIYALIATFFLINMRIKLLLWITVSIVIRPS